MDKKAKAAEKRKRRAENKARRTDEASVAATPEPQAAEETQQTEV
jgi:hypothetical protein